MEILVEARPDHASAEARAAAAAHLAHIVKFSDDRLSVLWSALPAPASDQVQVVTRGEHGAVARRGEAPWAESTAFQARSVDPGGAGDWTTAGLLYKLCGRKHFDEDDLVDALRFGQALAALNCEWPGARGLLDHTTPRKALSDAERLLRAKTRRRTTPSTRRRTRRRADECHACLAPRETDQETSMPPSA
jgi:fructokinase